jgi:dihydropteroate synthase
MLAKPPFRILRARGVSLSFGPRPLVMGILNVTPDSFSDGGAYASVDDAVAAAQRMIAEGADLIDVGGESTRPGHQSVNAETELSRVIPVIERLAVSTKVPISIDTSKAVVASAALKAGAHIVNDIWGLSHDDKIAAAITNAGAAVIIMHNREALDGSLDIFADMKRFFAAAADKVRVAGAGEDQIMVDPGIGFGKTLEQNLSILGHLERMHEYGYPVLLGASRKSFIGKISPSEPSDRLGGSVVTTVFAALTGISIVRVHDVAAHVQALNVIEATSGAPA